ncbi:uncharacterized protein LOC117112063 [Anneissia japonica]|uniref:uncharacterized protein LOC117112063 n=1 Tax=Anneissia japonica TaxID=1529436 RepID=UPI001425A0B8|nr:uncharacterized protein LOC117112063 [Anneissia japonica]
MDCKLLTFVFASFVVYVIRGQEFKCKFVPHANCIVNNSLEVSAVGELMEDEIREYDCIPTNMCSDTEDECKSFLLRFTSPLDAASNTTLHIAYQTGEGNHNIEQNIGLQKEYSFTFNTSKGYTIEFRCRHDQESFKYVLIDALEVACQTKCDISGSKSNTAIIIVVMILLLTLVVFVVLLILRRKRKAKEKAKFDRENPDYQSLKRNRASRQYQFLSMWQKRIKRNPSSASEQVYEVCGKIVECQKTQKDESDVLDYDYAYAQSVAGRLQKGFEDSGGYLKPDQLDEEAYLKPSPSSSKRSIIVDSNNTDKNGYLKPSSSKTNISSSPRNSKIETDITSDDDSDYEYVVPNDVIRDASPRRPNSETPKEKPIVPRKPKSAKSSPVTKRPQPSPRANKRASASADKDYLSIIEPERTLKQQSIKNNDFTT